jgi:hypothetical protein
MYVADNNNVRIILFPLMVLAVLGEASWWMTWTPFE